MLYLHLQSLHNITDLANHARPDAGGAKATEAVSGMESEGSGDSTADTAPAGKTKKKASAKKAAKGNGKDGD